MQLFNVNGVGSVERNASILLNDLNRVSDGPSVDIDPFFNNAIVSIFVERGKNLIDPVHFNPTPSVENKQPKPLEEETHADCPPKVVPGIDPSPYKSTHESKSPSNVCERD